MRHKHLKLLLFPLIGLSSIFISFNEILPVSESIILIPKKEIDPKRPKLPTRQIIQCIYQNGSLNFQFAIPEGECQLTVTDMTTGFSRQYVFDSSADATVYVGALTQAHIEISTANGHEYEGWLAMEW